MAIKFLQDYATKEAKPQTFHKDEVVDFYERYAETPEGVAKEQAENNRVARAQASENHFINRGVAVRVEQGQQARVTLQPKPFQPAAQPEPPEQKPTQQPKPENKK